MQFGLIVYRLGHQVFQPKTDHPLGGILYRSMYYAYITKSKIELKNSSFKKKELLERINAAFV
ncbi:MAG TPA: hypothetical protein DCS28_01555 [Candidatus Moranbacteria bacterium]|nr:hypothetical protein [Candidatus Moranbacteria bacterium]HAT74711.1 hypothetical protein [Candidatus Moranbacteria bacterium]